MGQTPQGAADKKSVGAHPRVRPNRKGGTMPSFLPPRSDWMAGVALLLGADPAWRCRFSDLANPPCTPGVLDACCLPVRTGLRCKYNHFKM